MPAGNSGFAGFGFSAYFEVGVVLEIKVIIRKKNLNLVPKPEQSRGDIRS